MELLQMMEISPAPELVAVYQKQLSERDWEGIRQQVRETRRHVLGKRREIMPSGRDANLEDLPEELARTDASFLMALYTVATNHDLAFRSIPGPVGERVILMYPEGGPDDDIVCIHHVEEWATCHRFQEEIGSWNWEAIRLQALENGSHRLGRRQDLLPGNTYLWIDEQALHGMPVRTCMLLDIYWLGTLDDTASQYKLSANLEPDPQAGEVWLVVRPFATPQPGSD